MAQSFRVKAAVAALEGTYGTDAVPTSTDAVLFTGDLNVSVEYETVARNLVKPFMGAGEEIPVGTTMKLTGDVELAGSGTQGTAPAWGDLILACGWAETVVTGVGRIASAATALGASVGTFTYTRTTAPTCTLPRLVTLTCTTGGASGVAAFMVAAPATTVDIAYSQTGVVMTDAAAFALPNGAVITPTVGTAFTAGDSYTLQLMPAYVYYTPVSDNIASLSQYVHFSKKRHKLLGARGNMQINQNAKGIPVIKLDFMGLYGGIAHEGVPPAVNLARWKKPVPVNNDYTAMPLLHGHAAPMYAFSYNHGAKTVHVNLPGQEFISLNDRESTGAITIVDPTLEDWDYYQTVKDVVLGGFSVIHGTTPGNIVEIRATGTQIGKPKYENKDMDVALSLDMRFISGDAGNDEVMILVY